MDIRVYCSLLFMITPVFCITLPDEWKEAIHSLCQQAERDVNPYQSPRAHIIYAHLTESASITNNQ